MNQPDLPIHPFNYPYFSAIQDASAEISLNVGWKHFAHTDCQDSNARNSDGNLLQDEKNGMATLP